MKTREELTVRYGNQGVKSMEKFLQTFIPQQQAERMFDALLDAGFSEHHIYDMLHDLGSRVNLPDSPSEPPSAQQVPDPQPFEMPKPEPKLLSPELQARKTQIETKGTPEYDRWMAGDKEIIAERDGLYEAQFPGQKVEIT
jgi:hypothetical protein